MLACWDAGLYTAGTGRRGPTRAARPKPAQRRAARRWLLGELDASVPVPFTWCCDVLGIDPATVVRIVNAQVLTAIGARALERVPEPERQPLIVEAIEAVAAQYQETDALRVTAAVRRYLGDDPRTRKLRAAGEKAARTRKHRARARKAWETRRARTEGRPR
jgi:hypothetical protein